MNKIFKALVHFCFTAIFAFFCADSVVDVFWLDETHFWPSIVVFGAATVYAAATLINLFSTQKQ